MSDQPPEWPSYPQDPGQQPPPPPPPYGAPPGGNEPYSPGNAITYGWNKFRENAGAFIVVGLLFIASQIGISLIGSIFSGGGSYAMDSDSSVGVGFGVGFSFVGTLFNILASIVAALFAAAAVRGALDVVEGHPVSIGGMFERWDKLQVLVAALLVGIASNIGFVLCILPGIVVVFLTWFTTFYIVGAGNSAIDGISNSVKFTAAHVGDVLVYALLAFLVMILGACACLVGLFVAYPVVMIGAAYTFRRLHGHPVAP